MSRDFAKLAGQKGSFCQLACVECHDSGMGFMMYVFIFGIIGMVLGYVVIVGMKLRSFGTGDFNSDRRRTATHSTLKRIILTHVQTLALVFGLSVPWPELMLNAISIVNSVTTFSENAKGIECLIEGQKDHAALYYGLLLEHGHFAVGVCKRSWYVLVYGGTSLAATKQRFKDGANGQGAKLCSRAKQKWSMVPVFSCGARDTACPAFIPSYSDMWVASGLLCWYLMLPSLMRAGFGVFLCRSLGRPEDKYLTIDMEEPCWQGRHAHFALLVGMPMLVLYAVTAPLGIIFRLSKAKKMRLAHPSILLRYGLIYSGYRSSKYWFELVVLVRKYLIIVASTFFVSDISQLQIVLGVMIIALSMHSTNDPFGRFLPDELLLHRK